MYINIYKLSTLKYALPIVCIHTSPDSYKNFIGNGSMESIIMNYYIFYIRIYKIKV